MSVANLKPYSVLEAMKPDQKVGKLEEGNDSLDSFIRQAIGKEPVLSFPRAVDSPVQWIQLLQALDYQDLPGWPLLSPPKIQMQKCDKCAREFCSTINYRRHKRVHRRALNIDKDFPKNREFLGIFWDKLSFDEAKEILSFKDIALEEVPGLSVVKALTSFICKPGFHSLPQVYVKAGSALLDIVQARPSRFPISSQELLNILDDASEKTFLCAGTALSMQKFVFDGEAAKIGLEMKNVVACTCFLLEQKLVKAWVADKDAEALRCQKLLMEEEEAAQRRQAELMERRRLKKLRQKEQQKAKEEQADNEETNFGEQSSDSLTCTPVETSSPSGASNFDSYTLEEPSALEPQCHLSANEERQPLCHPSTNEEVVPLCHLNTNEEVVPLCHLNTNEEVDASCLSGSDVQFDLASNNVDPSYCLNDDRCMKKRNGRRSQVIARRPSSSSHRGVTNGFRSGAVLQKLGLSQRQGVHKDQRSASHSNGQKIWTRKTKADNVGVASGMGVLEQSRDTNAQILQDSRYQPDRRESHEVLIGSIPVTLRESNGQCQGAIITVPGEQCAANNQLPQDRDVQEKHAKSDFGQCGTNRSVKLWRPVGKHEAARTSTVEDGERDTIMASNPVVVDPSSESEICSSCHSMDDNSVKMDSATLLEESSDSRDLKYFCSRSAEAFLAQRWNEAVAADHVTLVMSPESEPPNDSDHFLDEAVVSPPLNPNILRSSENMLSSVDGAPKRKLKAKNGKSARLKYIPKQRNHNY